MSSVEFELRRQLQYAIKFRKRPSQAFLKGPDYCLYPFFRASVSWCSARSV